LADKAEQPWDAKEIHLARAIRFAGEMRDFETPAVHQEKAAPASYGNDEPHSPGN